MNHPTALKILRPDPFSPELLAAAREEARASRGRVIDALETMAGLPAAEFIRRLAGSLRFEALTMEDLHRLAPAFDVLPFAEASQRDCVALRDGLAQLLLVIGDPFDSDTRAWAEERIQQAFAFRIAHPADIRAYLSRHEESLRAMDSVLESGLSSGARTETVESLSIASISEDDSPVVKLVSSTIYDALKSLASDIHFETTPVGLAIKYRLDGVLITGGTVEGLDLAEQVLSRIKVLAQLDIAERRIPQDGRFKVAVKGRPIDFRVSVMPSIHGEDAVLRILDKQALTDQLLGLQLASLGFDPESIEHIQRLATEPYGMLLVTGPTGSGKTTTLYAVLSEINNGQDKIITIEDPVEFQLPGVLQIPVNEQKGLTFARGLRSILRHDPDRIMVGEIRDPETAEIAVQSALTGHLVYTTVHANNAIDVLGRFQHMGVDAYNLVSALNGVLAQRLVRVFCKACKGKGCGECRHTGFKGRKAIGELLVLNDELRELITARAPARKLKEAARAAGTVPLRDAALALVEAGETTLEEINRVTFVA